ncbi:MAG: hypothetical protein OEV34_18670 [Gammaproteobacteria bacterium]|nr:hypothetical protein [Gammaproteobacteria bacterium]
MNRDYAETHRQMRWRPTALVVALGVLLCACSSPSTGPEGEIQGWLDRGVAAVEAKERSTLLDMISPAYADARGYNRSRVGDVLRAYFLRMNSIELLTTVNEITVMGDSAAQVLLTVGMAGTKDSLLGFSADAYQFSLELEKGAGDWKLISARWAQVGKELQ